MSVPHVQVAARVETNAVFVTTPTMFLMLCVDTTGSSTSLSWGLVDSCSRGIPSLNASTNCAVICFSASHREWRLPLPCKEGLHGRRTSFCSKSGFACSPEIEIDDILSFQEPFASGSRLGSEGYLFPRRFPAQRKRHPPGSLLMQPRLFQDAGKSGPGREYSCLLNSSTSRLRMRRVAGPLKVSRASSTLASNSMSARAERWAKRRRW
jgi:hypothetical protein